MLDGFDPAEIAAAVASRKEELQLIGESKAIRHQTRVKTRRVASDEQISSLVPSTIEPGESWHVLSTGDIDVLSLLKHLLAGAGFFDLVMMTTWRINKEDLLQIEAWLDCGAIETYHLIIDQRFQRLAPDEYQLSKRLADQFGGSVSMCLNHSKVTLCRKAPEDFIVIESSANVNTNRRLEQSAIHNSETLFNFYLEAFDAIRTKRNPSKA